MKKVLITGCGGLIGSEAVSFFCERGFQVVGIDNNMRQYFFGECGSVMWNIERLKERYTDFSCYACDIRNEKEIDALCAQHTFSCILHAAAQPSHDWAAKEPLTDFAINAQATLFLLECVRKYMPEAVFIFLSTNKVYGDHPNALPFLETPSRYDVPEQHEYYQGIDEQMSLDQCLHSVFGASKVAADIMVQEYGRYFGVKTAVFRGGCLSGSYHSGVALHGFLSYLVKSIVHGIPYTVFGYNGKQVRDNIHAFDVINAAYHFYEQPQCGAVYNMGGSRFSNVSIREAIDRIERITEKKTEIRYMDTPRKGDHQWYISNVSKFKRDYPLWHYRYTLDQMLTDMCAAESKRLSHGT